jgi:hypothetical protein
MVWYGTLGSLGLDGSLDAAAAVLVALDKSSWVYM